MIAICWTFSSGGGEAEELDRLLAQIAERDREALGMLYERSKSAVYGFILSILKNAQDAEDALQETYLQIYASAGSYAAQGKPMAWILTISKNLALMKIRERKRTADVSPEELEAYDAGTPGLSQEDRLVLKTATAFLSAEELQIVMLHAVAGFRHRETAELLGLPLSTVLSKYHRAMKKLRLKLTEGE